MKKSEMTLAQRLVNPNLDKKMEKVRLSERMFIQSNCTGVWSLFFEVGRTRIKTHLATYDFCNKTKKTKIPPLGDSRKIIELMSLTSKFETIS